MDSPYHEIQARMSRFGAAILQIIGPLQEAGLPASVIDQLVRSGTGVGSNYAEARGAESKRDFLHKLQLALKECREAKYWLGVARQIPATLQRTLSMLWGESDQFCAILYSGMVKAKNNGKDNVNGQSS